MRVVLVCHHALPHIGGVEVLVDQEIRALEAAGHSVVVITSDGSGAGAAPSHSTKVRVERLAAWHILERRWQIPYPTFSPVLLFKLWREIGRCDVVHAHGFIFMNSALSLLIAWLRGKPGILTDHGGIQRFRSRFVTILARLAIETVGRMSARTASRLVTYNSRIGKLLERLSGTTDKSLFLPNPIAHELFCPATEQMRKAARISLGWPIDRQKVLFVGRLIEEKGVLLLLQARDPAYDLVFCGPGDPAVLGNPIPPGIQYLGARPRAEIVSLYHAADVLVVPSDVREGFPVVVQEGLACGLPVVLTYEEGFEPYRGLEGLTMCDRTPDALRSAIKRSLSNRGTATSERMDSSLGFIPSPEEWLGRLYELTSTGK